MWNDIYNSFTNLLAQFKIGETVLVEGKLYSYFDSNQIYINSIRILFTKKKKKAIQFKVGQIFSELNIPLHGIGLSKESKIFVGIITIATCKKKPNYLVLLLFMF